MDFKKSFLLFVTLNFVGFFYAQKNPKIISDKETSKQNYLPDFSYAGYQFGEKEIPNAIGAIILATDFGFIGDDNLDDSKNLIKAINAANNVHDNENFTISYGPNSYIEFSNKTLKETRSLYQYQLKIRLKK